MPPMARARRAASPSWAASQSGSTTESASVEATSPPGDPRPAAARTRGPCRAAGRNPPHGPVPPGSAGAVRPARRLQRALGGGVGAAVEHQQHLVLVGAHRGLGGEGPRQRGPAPARRARAPPDARARRRRVKAPPPAAAARPRSRRRDRGSALRRSGRPEGTRRTRRRRVLQAHLVVAVTPRRLLQRPPADGGPEPGHLIPGGHRSRPPPARPPLPGRAPRPSAPRSAAGPPRGGGGGPRRRRRTPGRAVRLAASSDPAPLEVEARGTAGSTAGWIPSADTTGRRTAARRPPGSRRMAPGAPPGAMRSRRRRLEPAPRCGRPPLRPAGGRGAPSSLTRSPRGRRGPARPRPRSR